MRSKTFRGLVVLAVSVGVLTAVAPSASAQSEPDRTPEETVTDFIHFVRIGNFDVSAGLGGELIGLGLTDVEFVKLIDGTGQTGRFDRALADALRNDRLQPIAAELQRKYRAGKLGLARSPDEITRNIELLTSGLYGKAQARERLLAAGEYAMPQLLEALLQRNDVVLRAEVERLLVDMRGQAVTPLVTALPELAPADQEVVVSILERIGYRQALPSLADLYGSTGTAAVRDAAARAIVALGGDLETSAAFYYTALARAYFDELAEVTSFPEEDAQLLWSYDDGLGLVVQAIATEAYHEAMAMRYAERALALDAGDPDTLSLWLAANFSRETDSPGGYENPAYPSSRPDASYYAVLAGPLASQRVLGTALETMDTTLARQAIDAIGRTAGGMAMVTPEVEDGDSPLVRALGYADRRVRYDAALAVAASAPRVTFPGAEIVAPTLASMIRDADDRYAVVLTGPDREAYDRYASLLRAEGYSVLPPADGGLRDIRQAIAEAPGVELIVIAMDGPRIEALVDEVRATPKLAAAPVLALAPSADVPGLRPRFAFDRTTTVRRNSIDAGALSETLVGLVEAASGAPITQREAEAYIDAALAALRDLSIAENGVIAVTDASSQLVEAMDLTDGARRLRVAEVLAHVDDPAAQVALLDAALDAQGREAVALIEATTASVKRFGRRIEPRQTRRILDVLASPGTAEVAQAAAALAGSLGLSTNEMAPIILRDSTDRATLQARD